MIQVNMYEAPRVPANDADCRMNGGVLSIEYKHSTVRTPTTWVQSPCFRFKIAFRVIDRVDK